MSASALVAEAEVFAFVDLDGVERVAEDAAWRSRGRRCGESSSVKGRTRVASMPVAARSSSLCGERGDEAGGCRGGGRGWGGDRR